MNGSGGYQGSRRQRPGGYDGMYGDSQGENRNYRAAQPQEPTGYGGRPAEPTGYGGVSDSRQGRYDQSDGYGMGGGSGGGGYGGSSSQRLAQQQYDDRRGGSGGGGYRERPSRDEEPSDYRSNRRGGGDMTNGGDRKESVSVTRLDDILRMINRDWRFMTYENCIPVQVALQLSDPSSLGQANRLKDFQTTRLRLERALQAIVNEHHQGFNSSIGTYHSILRSITLSQLKVRSLREKMIMAKTELTSSKPEVKNLALESQKYEDMLQILNSIENLRGIPEKLDVRISEKRFLTAVELLASALTDINKPGMKEIGALQDLRRNLENQEASLADILVEELHQHLYLKSPYTDVRWRSYAAMKDNKSLGLGIDGKDLLSSGATKRPFQTFLETEDLTKEMLEDASRNIEAESLHYIRLLIESLHRLGHLPNALEQVSQRLPVELNKVVDKTNLEVDSRHPSGVRGGPQNFKDGKSIELCLSESDPRVDVLYDLLYTLFSKFEAILEGHRVIYDVVKGITKRDWTKESKETLQGGFVEVWKLVQSEIRSLLHDYLTTNESRMVSNAPKGQNPVNAILSSNSNARIRKNLFKMATGDFPNHKKADQDDLDAILKANVPGLVSNSSRPAEFTPESQVTDGSATGRKLLIEPTVFNMGHLLSPSLEFLQRIKDVVPASSGITPGAFTSFLDDFLVNVFLPQLDDTLRDLSNQTTGDLDAFQQDPKWSTVAQRPLMKGTSAFFSLITSICRMLDNIPHDPSFSQLIIDLLLSYHEKCTIFYNEIVSRDRNAAQADASASRKSTKKKCAAWVQSTELQSVMNYMWSELDNMKEHIPKEAVLLGKLKGDAELDYYDIITERKIVFSLCVLYNSMRWLASKIVQLRRVVEDDGTEGTSSRREPGSRLRRWTLIEAQKERDESLSVYLPLTEELVDSFDSVVDRFQDIANRVLFTLRAEARCHVVYHLDASLMHGNFYLESEPTEPDLSVMSLNSDLVWFDEDITTLLRENEQHFIKSGLGAYMDHLLITGSHHIKTMNSLGVDKMQLNILVLQQNLKNIENEVHLDRAIGFYQLFTLGPQDLITRAKSGNLGYTYEELKQLVTLWYSESVRTGSNRRDSSIAAKRTLNDHLIELSELMWDKE